MLSREASLSNNFFSVSRTTKTIEIFIAFPDKADSGTGKACIRGPALNPSVPYCSTHPYWTSRYHTEWWPLNGPLWINDPLWMMIPYLMMNSSPYWTPRYHTAVTCKGFQRRLIGFSYIFERSQSLRQFFFCSFSVSTTTKTAHSFVALPGRAFTCTQRNLFEILLN